MKTSAKIIAAVALVGASIGSAQAFWGPGWGGGWPWGSHACSPWYTWSDMFGDIDANFSRRGWGRGYGYGYPNYASGYGPGYYGVPYAGGYPYAAPIAPAVVAPTAPVAATK